jgi:membrane protein
MRHRRWLLPFRILKDAGIKLYEDEGLFLARGLAFGLLIYCIPLALLLVSAMSYTVAGSESALLGVRNLAHALAPQFQEDFSNTVADIVQNRGKLGIAGFLTFVFVSSATFGSLRVVLNKVFRAPEPRGIIHGKLMSIVMMLATSTLFFIVIAIVYVLTLIEGFAASLPWLRDARHILQTQFPALSGYLHPAALSLTGMAAFTLTVALFCFLYRFSPAKSPRWGALVVGALVGAGLFEISKAAFAWYIAYARSATMLYGALSGAVFFLFWLFYASVVFVFSAEISWILERMRR